MIRVNTDAAYNQKLNRAGMGIVVSGNGLHKQMAIPLASTLNNHTAEFEAVIYALRWLIDQKLTDQMIFIQTDSRVVVKVIENQQTKNQDYQPLLKEIVGLLEVFNLVTFDWVPESSNKGADNLARQAIQKGN